MSMQQRAAQIRDHYPATGSQWVRKSNGHVAEVVGRLTDGQPRVVVQSLNSESRATMTVGRFYRDFEPKES